MSNPNPEVIPEKKQMEFPHTIILYIIIGLLASLLTYFFPAGKYEFFEGTTTIDPNSFHYIENTPVDLMTIILQFQNQIATNGLVMSLLLVMGATTEILVRSGAINSIIDCTIKKYSEQSIKVVVPLIYLMMTVLGALNGNDSMIAYVAIGLLISKSLGIDRLCSVAMFYLAYITAQAAGPTTAIILIAQEIIGLPPLSGAGVRIIVLICFYIIGATYVTRYALKVHADHSKSVLGEEGFVIEGKVKALDDPTFGNVEPKAFIAVLSAVGGYFLFAYGSATHGWSWNYLIAIMMASAVIIGIAYRMNPNEFCKFLMAGAGKMGPICFLGGFVRVTAFILTEGNVIHSITYSVVNAIGGFGPTVCAVVLLLFNLVLNFILVGGVGQAQLVLPITIPMGEILGITPEVISMTLQFGDGLTNCMTPLSAPLMGALVLGGVTYPQWIKFVYKPVICNVAIAIAAIVICQSIGL